MRLQGIHAQTTFLSTILATEKFQSIQRSATKILEEPLKLSHHMAMSSDIEYLTMLQRSVHIV